MEPTPKDEFYDFLSAETVAYLIANQELEDLDEVLHFESVRAFKLVGDCWFPMKWEKMKCCVNGCMKEERMEIRNVFANGKEETKNYCSEHGKKEFQKLFRQMYGFPEKVSD